MHQHQNLFLRWLEESKFDVLEGQVEPLASRGLETQAVHVEFESAWRLLASHVWPHVHITQPVNLAGANELKRLLHHQVCLHRCLFLARRNSLSKLLDQAESVVQIDGILRLERELLNKMGIFVSFFRHLLRGCSCRNWHDEVDPEVGICALFCLRDTADTADVERHQTAVDRHKQCLCLAVHVCLIRLQCGRVPIRVTVGNGGVRSDAWSRSVGSPRTHFRKRFLSHLRLQLRLMSRQKLRSILFFGSAPPTASRP
mmetsp:Transcript_18075/g.38527  ORF Transcript_18075/g.38527 Transcript_18075/m.38527 type:complete len:257 (-) Transcript_18075:836-1606(-)